MNRLGRWLVGPALGLALGLPVMAVAAGGAPDPQHGRTIVASTCAACHGLDGNSTQETFPKLAGQHAAYIVKELQDFKAQPGPGARQNPVMSAFAGALSPADMRDVAAYYSAQTPVMGVAHDTAKAQLGQRIYRGGIAEKGVPACAACHGPVGHGLPAQYPRLSSQWSGYMADQLHAFQSGGRANSDVMRDIATRLSASEIDAVSEYAAGLH